MKAYHFTSDTLRDGSPIPAIGEELVFSGRIEICVSGLHASKHPFDALAYAPGNLLHLVDCRDIREEQKDKFVCSSRTILKTIDSTKILQEFSRKCALEVIHLWDCPSVVREYLETGREEIREAAWAASWDAARAARDAAGNAAGNAAAWAAAWAAAGDAAWDAAWAAWAAAEDAASWDAAEEKQRILFLSLL